MDIITSPKTYSEIKNNIPFDCQVTISPLMDDRWTQEKWIPPPASRFFELTSDDESWAKSLGLGTIEIIDIGPLILTFKKSMTKRIEKLILDEPRSLFNYDCSISTINLNSMKYGF